MSYRAKIDASYEKAHNAQIATKILQEMNELRDLVGNQPKVARRWVWELIQNARDVGGDGVKIYIEYRHDGSSPEIVFRHNGGPFTAEDIRFLIEQVSSKQRTKDEDGKRTKSGKFGTGFLTTHLLNERVMVSGVAKEPDLPYVSFSIELDRSGFEPEEILDGVQRAKDQLNDIDSYPALQNYIEHEFNTGFRYPLNDEISKTVAKDGIQSIDLCLPYVFAFVPELTEVTVSTGETYTNSQSVLNILPGIDYIEVIAPDWLGEPEVFSMLKFSKNFTSIVVPVTRKDEKFYLKEIGSEVPRLFCDFPLIGSEQFYFPAIINNPNFNPTEPRDGIFMSIAKPNPKAEENRKFLLEAVELYYQLLKLASAKEFGNLHLLAEIEALKNPEKWMDTTFYSDKILEPVRDNLLYEKVVRTATGKLSSVLSKETNKPLVHFPVSSSKELRSDIWKLCADWMPGEIPHEDEVELWNKLAWKKFSRLGTEWIASKIQDYKYVSALEKDVMVADILDWLVEYYQLIEKEHAKYDQIVNNFKIFPDQNRMFQLKGTLYMDKGDIDPVFKEILELLRADIKPELLIEGIQIGLPEDRERGEAYAVRQINEEVNEKVNDREVAKAFQAPFRKLLIWFKQHPSKAQSLFPSLYSRKFLLYDEEEVMENIERAEQLKDIMAEFNATTLEEIREMLSKSQTESEREEREMFTEMTEKLVMGLGISNEAEWLEVLKDPKLAERFHHMSVPTPEMYDYAQVHIARAKENVVAHLQSLPNYDIAHADFTAKTVMGGVLKDGREVNIVIRPAYEGYVIIYYGSELDTLEYTDAELWVDTSEIPKNLTLGYLFRKAKIKKFPV